VNNMGPNRKKHTKSIAVLIVILINVYLSLFIFNFDAVASDTGATLPGTAASSNANSGTVTWSDVDYIKNTNEGEQARSRSLGFGETIYWRDVKIIKSDGSIGSTDKATGTLESSATHTFGGASDLWGEFWSYSDINDADFGVSFAFGNSGGTKTYILKATNFGFSIGSGYTIDGIKVDIKGEGLMGGAYVDWAKITVYYSSASPPSITTRTADTKSTSGFRTGGTSLNDNGATITDKGVFYGTSNPPGTKSSYGSGGTDSYYVTLSSLSENTLYYYRAYAVNTNGYGNGSVLNCYTLVANPTDNEFTRDAYGPTWMRVSVAEPPNPTAGNTGAYFDCVTGGATDSGWVTTRSGGRYYHNFTGLTSDTTYGFKVKLRNGDSVETTLTSEKQWNTSKLRKKKNEGC